MGISSKIILIVDDSMSIRRELRAILEKRGYEVREAGNGKAMSYRLVENKIKPGLILMDISLKGENGLDLVEQIRNDQDFEKIPIIMLTAYTDKENVLKAKSMHVQGFLKKPISSEELIKRVNNVLSG